MRWRTNPQTPPTPPFKKRLSREAPPPQSSMVFAAPMQAPPLQTTRDQSSPTPREDALALSCGCVISQRAWANNSGIPLAALVDFHPPASLQLPQITRQPARCKTCAAYCNPYVKVAICTNGACLWAMPMRVLCMMLYHSIMQCHATHMRCRPTCSKVSGSAACAAKPMLAGQWRVMTRV